MQDQVFEHAKERTDSNYKRHRVVLLVLLLFLLVAVVLLGIRLLLPQGVVGSRIIPQFSTDLQEEQDLLSEQVEKSRITVSLIPSPYWDEETQELSINFVVSPGNNGFSERFVIQQEGRIVYESARVMPGYALARVKVPDLHPGAATATVFAVDKKGNDHGSPVSVELSIRSRSGDRGSLATIER